MNNSGALLNKSLFVLRLALVKAALTLGCTFISEHNDSFCNAHAQSSYSRGGARGTAARAIGQLWKVKVREASLHGGPSSAYSSRGRVYQGETVTILEVTGSQEWAKVSTPSGIQAWIRVSDLERPQDQVAQDPGRYRRQTDYQYDAQGRRVTTGGDQVGSGQGTGEARYAGGGYDPPPISSGSGSAPALELAPTTPPPGFGGQPEESSIQLELLPVGYAYLSRTFRSNIGMPPLSGISSQVGSVTFGGRVMSEINAYLHADLQFTAAVGSSVPLPALPSLPNSDEPEVNVRQYLGDLQVSGGAPIGPVWLGGVLGIQYYQLAYTEVILEGIEEPFSPLQSHQYFSGLVGARISMKLSSFSADLRGGVALPFSFDQSPSKEGQWSTIGLWSKARLSYHLNPTISVGVTLGYLRYGSEYKGPADFADYTLRLPTYYTEASGVDETFESLLHVGFTL